MLLVGVSFELGWCMGWSFVGPVQSVLQSDVQGAVLALDRRGAKLLMVWWFGHVAFMMDTNDTMLVGGGFCCRRSGH